MRQSALADAPILSPPGSCCRVCGERFDARHPGLPDREHIAQFLLTVEAALARNERALAALRRAMDRSEALLRGEVASPAVACRCEMQEHGE